MGADVPGAHALLATIEPASVGPALLEPVLDALLKGAGGSRGLALDAASRCHPASRGLQVAPAESSPSSPRVSPVAARTWPSYDAALLARMFGENASRRGAPVRPARRSR